MTAPMVALALPAHDERAHDHPVDQFRQGRNLDRRSRREAAQGPAPAVAQTVSSTRHWTRDRSRGLSKPSRSCATDWPAPHQDVGKATGKGHTHLPWAAAGRTARAGETAWRKGAGLE